MAETAANADKVNIKRRAGLAGLRYVSDQAPGWTRRRSGQRFVYHDEHGQRIADRLSLQRIASLVIPPAWENVWICPDVTGHLQATGRDQKGRKVYRYHDRFRACRDETKYDRLSGFAAAMPAIRQRIEDDLNQPCMTRQRVLATVLHLLDRTHVRIGNARYARENEHFGLTTLRRRHVQVRRGRILLDFIGKSGQQRHIELEDPRVARSIRQCWDLPGYELFKYRDEAGETCRVDSEDVNDYLRQITGDDFTAKHFRTWAGTVIAAVVLCALEPFVDDKELKANLVTAVKTTAHELGNRPATCRKYYIHPLIFEAYEDGSLAPAMQQTMAKLNGHAARHRMAPEEAAILALLQGVQKD